MTRILGNLNIVISFSMLSTALQFEHLYPQASILSEAVYPLMHSLMSMYPVYLTAFLGIEIDRSIKLSKVNDLCLHDMHSSLLQSYPSKRSVIIELSRALKYWSQISDYSSIVYFSQFISLYAGFLTIRFNSLCMPSRRNLKNSWASC